MTQSRDRRVDIDGLRALAIGLVVAYHVWFGRVSGGVDVFLMVSAFFMTRTLARQLVLGESYMLATYWLSRFRRLLPAAAVTLVGVLLLAMSIFPASSWADIWSQTWASLFYVQNWELARESVDYYARREATPSPLMHFWSLSVQGQVFVLWPILIMTTGYVARRYGRSVSGGLIGVFAFLFAASFAYSVVSTHVDQQFAYFDTFARLWEFALGSLLALLSPLLRFGSTTCAIFGWTGLVGLVSCGAVLDVQGGFPGYLALWPTLSAAAIIISGQSTARWGPARVLGARPLVTLGRVAYPLYLVHWPVLVAWFMVSGRDSLGAFSGTAVILLSLAIAWAMTYWVDDRVARWVYREPSRPRGVIALMLSVTAVVVPLATWQSIETARAASIVAASSNPGAAVLLPGGVGTGATYDTLVPVATDLADEWVSLDGPCSGPRAPRSNLLDSSCVERISAASTGTIVVIGDSHAQQWMGAVLPIAQAREKDVVALLKAGCAFALGEPPVRGVTGCEEWREAALAYIHKLEPDLVVGMATKSTPDTPDEAMLGGLQETVDALSDFAPRIVLIRDNPRFASDMFRCVEDFGAASPSCVRNADEVLASVNPARSLASGQVTVVDMTDYLCPEGVCLPVIGGVVVYLDDDHLTGTFARTLAPALEREL